MPMTTNPQEGKVKIMKGFTYEFENSYEKLETYEWDNVWWEHANVTGAARALYIGDSISCGTRRIATEVAEEKIYFDGFGTSKAVDNPYFAESVRSFARQQGERDVVFFNNGLHGWHLDDKTEYPERYEELVKFLVEEFEGTPVAIVLTTAVADPVRDARVVERNKAAIAIAEKYGLPVVDLYSIVKDNMGLLVGDGVHLRPEGYRLLATELVARAKEWVQV